MNFQGRSSTALRCVAAVASLAFVAGCSPSDVDWSSPSVGRDSDGTLYLIGAPCSSNDLTALSIVEASTERPVLRIEFAEPTMAWDVIIPLDPLDVDDMDVAALDEAVFDEAMSSTGDEFEIVSEIRSRIDGSERREVTPFRPGLLPNNAATDYDEIIDDPAGVGCPRGGQPWGDVFSG